ncbi:MULTISPECIES: hypothetical protein [unclassified Candidatus Cardinium]|uniref:hypothetical protein n=1 Tax=unclassified Candidatus Cardinium TaxID=2641185 RepID=UPI001FB485F1|nr:MULTISPECIES: hypothetical protein [unclassified Candidatus Cardinium]
MTTEKSIFTKLLFIGCQEHPTVMAVYLFDYIVLSKHGWLNKYMDKVVKKAA